MPEQAEATVCFYRLIPTAPLPRRAERSAGGLVPTRALRFCDPLTTATANGWWVFPPCGFSLMWDGSTGMLWTPDGGDAWFPLETAQFPDFARHFAAVAPPDLARFAPPFLVALVEPGVVQIWSGWVARTKPGWSLHVRSPVNFPHPQGVDFFEGIVETDGWFGPLFVNVRLTKTHAPVLLRSGLPLMQATPVRRSDYSDSVLNDVRVFDKPSDWTDREWEGFRRTVAAPNLLEDRPLGLHASLVRRARKRSD